MGNIISFRKSVSIDPIIRKGDLVKLVDDPVPPDEEAATCRLGQTGVVIGIVSVFGPDHLAEGQASSINIGFPDEDGWEIIDDVPIECVHRVLGPEAFEIRGHDV